MFDRKLYDAYDSIRPSNEAKSRMLDNIMESSAALQHDERHSKSWKRTVVILAAAAAVLLFTVSAYALGWFGLGDLFARRESIYFDGNLSVTEFDTINLGGFSETPEYRAAMEWHMFVDTYDPDGAILRSIGDGTVNVDERYMFYNCYTPEMADELDRIAAKYDLRLLSDWKAFESLDELYSYAGTGDIIKSSADITDQYSEVGYAYSDGTLFIEGAVTLTDSGVDWVYPIDYQFIRNKKGTLTIGVLNVEEINEYEQWEYITGNDVHLLLALGPKKALIIADRESSFVTVNVLNAYVGDVLLGEVHMSRQDLEALAECFDFSVIP